MSILDAQLDAVDTSMPFGVRGEVTGVIGMTIEAIDLTLPLGSLCRIESFGGKGRSTAEVIGFRRDRTLLMPLSSTAGVARGDSIESISALRHAHLVFGAIARTRHQRFWPAN